MKTNKSLSLTLAGISLLMVPANAVFSADIAAAPALSNKVSVNMKDVDIHSLLTILAQQGGFPISMSSDVEGKVSIGVVDASIKDALDQICADYGFTYTIRDGGVYVSRVGGGFAEAQGSGTVHTAPLHYASCQEVSGKVVQMLGRGEKILTDETSNSIVFVGSDETFAKIKEMIAVFDSPPKQILIQGLIVQTSNQFLQNIGFSAGDSSRTAAGNGSATSAYVNTAGPSPANLGLLVGQIGGRTVGLAIQAAESSGEAKIISRPKIVTMNNKPASFNSGVSFNVKTLSTVQTGQPGTAPVAATGGVTTINAGLTVNITPTVVGDGEVKLTLNINDSNPDTTSLATPDGIPNIDTNSANTTVIVKSDHTAVIAGLVVDNRSTSSEGVPILKDIPLLGYLFQNHAKNIQNNELAIFITPSILGASNIQASMYQPPTPDTASKAIATEGVPPQKDGDAKAVAKAQTTPPLPDRAPASTIKQ